MAAYSAKTLPKDYLEKSIKIKDFSHIALRALQPVDIIVTKIGRLNARDMQDIEACIKKANVSETEIKERSMLLVQSYVGPEEDYLYHLNLVLDKFFKKQG